jgi:glycosyltransferase involved in cell wall biosynthesis
MKKVRKPRIAHIATIDMSLHYLLLNQLRILKQVGYEVVGISASGPEVPSIEAAGIRHISVEMTRSPFTPLLDLRALWQLYYVISQGRFDIVHTHTPKAGLLGRCAAKLAGVPVVVHTSHGLIFHERSPWYSRRFFIAIEKLAAWCSDLILSVNEEDVITVIKEGICDFSKIKVLSNGGIGIDLERFDPASVSQADIAARRREVKLSDENRVVGFVGRLVEDKGLLELFEAIHIVQNRMPKVRLLVIGPVDTEKPDAVTPDVVEEYGIADVCRFLGLRQDLPELYSLMDVFVLPSHREGFPVVPMEASAMGIPCVLTDVRGCREVVEHGQNGLLVPFGDVDALADAIYELLTDDERAQQMGKKARCIAMERFDEQKVFEKVEAEYARLLHAKDLPVPEPTERSFPDCENKHDL